ncbi:MAG: transcriptional repressor, partial [bacterium]|nr:transcriptional repressor [bacterium]
PIYPTMSLATVYKALKTLVEVGLVQEINVGEGNFRYDGTVNDHAHIQCLKCGRVDDLETVEFPDLNALAEQNSNYKIKWNKLFFYGICGERK